MGSSKFIEKLGQVFLCKFEMHDLWLLSIVTGQVVADPEFPRRGVRGWGNSEDEGANLLFGKCSPKNSMQMKDIGP